MHRDLVVYIHHGVSSFHWRYIAALFKRYLKVRARCSLLGRTHSINMSASGSARRSTNPASSVLALQQARFRPWEQQDLLHRLHTFKPRTWFGKPAHINALVCARHGWINHGPDKLSCEVQPKSSPVDRRALADQDGQCRLQFCGESLELHIRPKHSVEDVQKVGVS